jgi:transcriptional regulator with XRE-family HTH domain
MDIGAHVRAVRQARELSQEALARRADVSLNVVNRLERCVISDSHYSTLERLADALGVSVEELVKGPKSYGGALFEQYLEAAREKSRDELLERYAELDALIDELSKDPAGLPRKVGGQASPRHLRRLTESLAEFPAIGEVLRERAASKAASKVPVL